MHACVWFALSLSVPSQSLFQEPAFSTKPAAEVIGPAYRFGDFDGDGLADVYVVDPLGTDGLFKNLGKGAFEDVTAAHGLGGIEGTRTALWWDFDGDHALDLYVSSAAGKSRLFQNTGAGMFIDVTAASGLAHAEGELFAEVLDFDLDQRPDLHVVTERGDVLFHNVGHGSFERAGLPQLTRAGAIVVDLADADAFEATAIGDDTDRARSRAETRRRLGSQAGTGAGSPDPLDDGSTSGPLALNGRCSKQIKDDATGNCLSASTTPTLGMLYPLSTNLNVTTGGNVGIGLTAPANKLEVAGGIKVDALDQNTGTTANALRFGGGATGEGIASKRSSGGNQYGLDFYTNALSRIAVTLGGSVGIGTAAPECLLHVLAGSAGAVTTNGESVLTCERNGNAYVSLLTPDANERGILFGEPSSNVAGGVIYNSAAVQDGMELRTNGNQSRVAVTGSGNVGIGTTSPAVKLAVAGGLNVDYTQLNTGSLNNSLRFGDSTSGEGIASKRNPGTNQYGLDFYTGSQARMTVTGAGNVGIGTNTPIELLDVNGATRTKCVKITGGCDLAEPFEFVERGIQPGMIVAIDGESEGKLRLAQHAYDTTVAGVVSGAGGVNAGMTMAQRDVLDVGEPVALAGRVYCWCDATYGQIRPGDLLTSSDTPGHAMKVADRSLASGAIVGKALTSLSEGRGLVLIVVSLQ